MRRGDDDFPVFPVFPPDLFCGGHWEVKLTFRTFRKCATPLEPDAVLDPGPLEALPDGFPSVYDRFRRFMWRGPTPKLSANQALVRFPPSRAPFKNGENGENGASSHPDRARKLPPVGTAAPIDQHSSCCIQALDTYRRHDLRR